MKKIIAAITTALLAVGVAVVGVAAPATASPAPVHTITSTCAALTVDLSGYADTVPAVSAVYHDWTETVIDVPEIPAKPAVTHSEYEWFTWYKGDIVTKWAAQNPSHGFSFWWGPVGSRTVVDTPAQDAVPAVTHTVNHHDLVTAAVPEKTNSVFVTIDGAQKANTTFGTSYAPAAFAYPADFKTHTYSVQITAWDGSGTYSTGTLDSGDCTAAPVATLDHLGACYPNNGFSSSNVYVKLDNSNSPVAVTFTGNGINQTVPARTVQVAEATPMWDHGGGFTVTAAGQRFDISVPSFDDCGASITPYVQGPWVGTCQLPSSTRTVEFWFDNTGSNRDVTYTVGARSIVAPAGRKVHFDADAALMTGGSYTVTANGQTWHFTVPASDCLTVAAAPVDPTSQAVSCGVDPALTLATTTGVDYTITSFNPKTGKYTVTATPKYGFKFAGGQTSIVLKGQVAKMVKCVIDAALTSTVTPVCGSADVLVTNTALTDATTRAKAGVAKVWVDGVLSDQIRVTAGSHVTKTFTFAEDSTYNGGTQHDILVKFGQVQLATATVESNCLPPVVPSVTPPTPLTQFTVGAPRTPTTPNTTPGESLTTLALLPASATATDQVCAPNGDKTSGYISVALLPEDQTAVQYSVDGTALTSAKTEMKPGSYTVTASPRDSGEGLTASSWNLTIASAADCAAAAANTVTTQQTADTGSGFPIWALLLIIFLVLLLLGVVFFLIARRRRREADAS